MTEYNVGLTVWTQVTVEAENYAEAADKAEEQVGIADRWTVVARDPGEAEVDDD